MRTLITSLILVVCSTTSYATTIVLDMSDRGWYRYTGRHNASNQNTFTGPAYGGYNSWFLFDLSGLSGSFTSATLRLEMERWSGSSSTGTASIWDYNSSLSALVSSHSNWSSEGMGIYNDLETGVQYATQTVGLADVGNVVEFTLAGTALADINSAVGGLFALGTNLTGVSASNWLRWSRGTENRIHQLVLNQSQTPVPEPSTFVLLGLGLAGMIFARRKKQN